MKNRYEIPLTHRLLGPIGRFRLQKVSSVGEFERDFLTLESTNTSISLINVNDTDCLASLQGCDGFGVTIWIQARSLGEEFPLLTAPILKITYSTDDILQAQLAMNSSLCTVKANIKKGKISILLVKVDHSGIELNIDGTLRDACKGNKWEHSALKNFSSFNTISIGQPGKSSGEACQIDIYYVAIHRGIVTEQNVHTVHGLTLKEMIVLKFYDHWWTFSGELRLLQQFTPSLVGKGAKLVSGPDGRSWIAQGKLNEKWGVVLATVQQTQEATLPPFEIFDPTNCSAVVVSLHIKIESGVDGDLLRHCGHRLQGWHVKVVKGQIDVTVGAWPYLYTRPFWLKPDHFGRRVMLHLIWTKEDYTHLFAYIGEQKLTGGFVCSLHISRFSLIIHHNSAQ